MILDVDGTDIEKGFHECGIPGYMRPGLRSYLISGVRPGDFLCAVLENDLKSAVQRADFVNENLLPNYVKFLYNFAPMTAWGSDELVRAWVFSHAEKRRLEYEQAKTARGDCDPSRYSDETDTAAGDSGASK